MMKKLITAAVERGSEAIHIKADDVFRARINGELVKLSDEPFTPMDTRRIVMDLLPTDALRERIDEIMDYDFAWELEGVARFRVNILRQRGTCMVVMRVIPWKVPSFEDLGLPLSLAEIAKQPDGLVMVTGAAGVGKSTTQAAMIDWINRNLQKHIIPLEDPIEHWHDNVASTVTQL